MNHLVCDIRSKSSLLTLQSRIFPSKACNFTYDALKTASRIKLITLLGNKQGSVAGQGCLTDAIQRKRPVSFDYCQRQIRRVGVYRETRLSYLQPTGGIPPTALGTMYTSRLSTLLDLHSALTHSSLTQPGISKESRKNV